MAAGAFLLLLRWVRRRHRRRIAGFRLKPGQKAGLVVDRPGFDPVSFRIDDL